jgi:hypothetical protein
MWILGKYLSGGQSYPCVKNETKKGNNFKNKSKAIPVIGRVGP